MYMCPIISTITHFYPRSPCGERLTDVSYLSIDNTISIHALLAESDGFDSGTFVPAEKFLSTLSLRRATRAGPPRVGPAAISIHALLAESDSAHRFDGREPSGISIHALLAESDL